MPFLKQTRGVFRDISNYFFIWKVIRKNRDTEGWKVNRLRHDWVGRIYTVVSLKPEDHDDDEAIKRMKVLDLMQYPNIYLSSLGLQEILFPAMQKIDDSLSYLIVYVPFFRHLTQKWILKSIFFLSILTTAIILATKFL
jgi:hypothetical protein